MSAQKENCKPREFIMNKFSKIMIVVFIVLSGVSVVMLYNIFSKRNEPVKSSDKVQTANEEQFNYFHQFTDGLRNPDSVTNYELDKYGMGPAQKSVYYVDINGDKTPDRITKTFIETGNAHSYYKYTIELKSRDRYIDITPQNFQTTNGDTCDLQQIKFSFSPQFTATLISRELGDTWNTPTMAYEQNFTLSGNKMVASKKIKRRFVCDVKELL